jgi:hypothetical protein
MTPADTLHAGALAVRGADFVQTFLDHLVSWDFVEKNMSAKPKL